MTYKDFKQEVTNNRPRMALVYLVPVLDELYEKNEALLKEVEALKELLGSKVDEPKAATASAKKPVAKKAAAPEQEAENKEELEEIAD